ncbi:MAG: 50S ribosomal protein L13 [Chloroflexi bacterium]|nr:50S ribosomal protein L13 [Chloroflexota bacterium]
MTQKTYSPKAGEIQRVWHVLDATDRPLGRLASEIAILLRGKHKPTYAPFLDVGDYVVVVNAAHVGITGKNKPDDKIYYSHSRYPGGLHSESLRHLLARFPDRVIERSVRGMLPKNALGRALIKKLHVYAGATHPHHSQTKELSE